MSREEIDVVLLALSVALQGLLLALIPGVVLAWILARWRSPLNQVLRAVVMAPLVLPPVVTGYLLLRGLGRSSSIGRAWFELTGNHLAYSRTACVIAAAVVGLPLLVESLRLALAAVDPRLELVSRSLGRGRVSTFLRITLPLALPGLVAGSVLAFARALGEFGATIIFAGNTAGETRQIPLAVHALLNVPGAEASVTRLVVISVALSVAALLGAALLGRLHERRAGQR